MRKYSAKYFIDFFERIPEEKWCKGRLYGSNGRACSVGCQEALKKAGRDGSPMTAKEIRDMVSRDWGNKLISVLGWKEVNL